jgi:C4-dicarboxylate transporter DctQ subunit
MWSFLDRWLTRFENVCLALGTAVAVSVAAVQVVLRYGAGLGLYWGEELVVYSVVWTAFIAAGAAIRSGEHLSVEFVKLLAKGRAARPVACIIDALCAAAGVALLILGLKLVIAVRTFGQLSPAMQIPMWIVYLAIPISGALITIRSTQQFFAPPPEPSDRAIPE